MSGGYSYTTLAAGRDEPVGVSFFLDARAWIEVIGSGTEKPHLHVELGDVSVNFGPCSTGMASAGDVRIARALADQAAAYAAEIERLNATSPAVDGGSAAA
jgi:hypothetical protein